jgi:hypothetical protein
MMSAQDNARRAIMAWREPSAPERTAQQLITAIKLEVRALLSIGELDRSARRRERVAKARHDLVECWPNIRNGRVSAKEIRTLGFYNIVGDQAAMLAILITYRRERA